MIDKMTQSASKNFKRRIFISYVRENQDLVDRLSSELMANGVQVWLDRNEIMPGTRWKEAIRDAISNGAFFLSCFSNESVEKTKSYMNEELSLAIEEVRLRSNNRTWFIPVRFNNCVIPDRNIGGGERLTDLQWVDLFEDWDRGIHRLVAILNPVDREHEEIFEDAFMSIADHLRSHSRVSRDRQDFTLGLAGRSGVGKSSLLRSLVAPGSELDQALTPRSVKHVQTVANTPSDPWPNEIFYDSDMRYYSWPTIGRVADIPALGYDDDNSAEAKKFIREQVDLLLYAIPASRRIEANDIRGIDSILKCDTPVIVTINKIDTMNDGDDKKLVDYVNTKINNPVVSLSAFTGLNIPLLRQLVIKFVQLREQLRINVSPFPQSPS